MNFEQRFLTCELLLQRLKRKGILHSIVTGDKKQIEFDNRNCRKSWGMPCHAAISFSKPNIHRTRLLLCICWGQQSVAYELLKPNHRILLSTSIEAFESSLKRKMTAIRARMHKCDFLT
ncbi:putative mariner mos1 transposase [Trichonephila inaurata madagascariensis]|uniref:Putative mariner mos1 transposase n=1 Tax=Trichonephila inaurata madagascariensis TaxID=2747483 RepID=A0A8X6YHW4_9ARAC|nr:putative mariner mos1 transposase [Trichonephila inaurata madagascariensis]